jgi:hypothetical protein
MLLSDLLDQLTYGELTQLEYGGVDDEGMVSDNYKRVIPHINLGLSELHKRFLLRAEEIIIDCEDHISTYHLTREYARTNETSTQPYKYIHDSIFEPFQDNVLKIEKVFNENGKELFLNTKGAVSHIGGNNTGKLRVGETPLFGMDVGSAFWGVHTPSFNTVQIPFPMETNSLLVEYRADHPRINVKDLDPSSTEVEIPSYLLEALLQYVSARAYTSLGGEGGAQQGMTFMAKFEASVAKAEQLGLVNIDIPINQKLEVNGWV